MIFKIFVEQKEHMYLFIYALFVIFTTVITESHTFITK
jgi:hypothetical protein